MKPNRLGLGPTACTLKVCLVLLGTNGVSGVP
jgi:hypothetical protein